MNSTFIQLPRFGRQSNLAWLLLLISPLVQPAWSAPTVRRVTADGSQPIPAAVVVEDCELIHTTQLLPISTDAEVVGPAANGQLNSLLNQLDKLLSDCGAARDDVVKLNVYVKDAAVRDTALDRLVKWFDEGNLPAVSWVGTKLPVAQAHVALDAVIARAKSANNSLPSLRVLGANSRRADYCVLPRGDVVYVSGQAEAGDLAKATRSTLGSLERTLHDQQLDRRHIVSLKCFLSPMSDVALVNREIEAFFADSRIPPVSHVEWISGSRPIEIELIAYAPSVATRETVSFHTPPWMKSSPVFSRVARIHGDRRIYISGLYSSSGGSAESQVADIFRSLTGVLAQAGSDVRHLAKATYYVADSDSSSQLNAIRPSIYDPQRPPAASKAMVNSVAAEQRGITLDMIAAPSPSYDEKPLSESQGRRGMVVSVSPPATRIGVEILKIGGNAVDAAIAVEFALAVTWPEAGNIGGGGFMMVHPATGGKVVCIDYREVAPAAATETMFKPGDGRHTHKIVGVPGTVRGMATAHERFGKLEWKQLVMPAVRLAEKGFEVDAALARSLNGVLNNKSVQNGEHHQELIRVYGKPAGRWTGGDRLVQPDLARTLRRIADQGAKGFYEGDTADLLAAEMQRGDGLITTKDLAGYRSKVRPAIHGKFRGYDVHGPPPPSSGGICLVQMLNVLEQFDLREHGRFSPRTLHLIAETMKRAFRDRALYLGDADFVEIPEHLTQKPYAQRLAASMDPQKATPSDELAPEIKIRDESPSTTHFSVIDSEGLAVSNTTTLEGSWGARIVVRGAGFVLNNEMGDFNWFPGHTDRVGRIGTKANRVQPGKRMLSSQSPTIIAKDGRAVLVTGSPGGRTIINTSLQMVLNVIEFEMDLPAAMRAARVHHQWLPDQLTYETHDGKITNATAGQLRRMGHRLKARPTTSHQGDAHSIFVNPKSGLYHGVADWRRNGFALGY